MRRLHRVDVLGVHRLDRLDGTGQPEGGQTAVREAADRRDRVTAKVAVVGLCLVLMALTVFAVGVAVVGSRQGDAAATGGAVSAQYQRTRQQLAALESLRQQRLLDREHVLTDFDREYRSARTAFGDSMQSLLDRKQSGEQARAVEQLWHQSLAYLIAVDRSINTSTPAGAVVREGRVDGLAAELQRTLARAGEDHQRRAERALEELRLTQDYVVRATPLVFAVGLLLVVLAGRVLQEQFRRTERLARAYEYDALHDALTGLPNRLHLSQRLDRELAATSRGAGRVTLMLLDLDRFKAVNDSYGHECGDAVLRCVARRLSEAPLPAGTTVARLGGDEFAVLLPPGQDTAATELAFALAAALEEPIATPGAVVDVGASIGVAASPGGPDAVSALLRSADLAMYAAKQQGERVVCHDPLLEPNQDTATSTGRLLHLT